MLYPLALVALTGLAAASPATQPIDFGLILAATSPTFATPLPTVAAQTGVYNAGAAAAAASAAVTQAASASATQSIAARDALQKRTWCFFGFCIGGSSSWSTTTSKPVSPTSCTTTPVTPVTVKSSSPAITTPTVVKTTPVVTSSPVITSSASITTAPSTCTPISWTNTFAFTTATGCAAPFEVGTYCGFINPEDPCAPQPDGNGPHVLPDTPDAFKAYPEFHQTALSAKTPAGYASTFKDANGSVNANTYLGLHTLTSYDVAQCASFCDSTSLCTGINIYIERDPSINPEKCSCTNPASITNYKCTLWGSGVDQAAATNYGQTRDGFQVVITGSNGYEKTNTTTPQTPSGWNNPQSCSGSVHSHPSTCMGQKFFPGPFDVNVCAAYAAAQNTWNFKSFNLGSWASWFGYSPLKCNFFNAFMVKQDGVAQGTYCSLFSQQYAPAAANYQPSVSSGHSWGIESSWSFCSS